MTIAQPTTTGIRQEPVGMVILDDPKGLAPRVAHLLRSAAQRIGCKPLRSRGLQRPRGVWPLTTFTTKPAVADGAGRPGRTHSTITHGILAKPALRISTHTVVPVRMMWWDPADYLLALARLAEGGDGPPSRRDLRRVAVASMLCGSHPAHTRDMIMLNSATAFEPAFLYDEGPRYTTILESRILRAGEGISEMIEALPRITKVAIVSCRQGVPGMNVSPFADKADGPITEDDLELVGRRSVAAAPTALEQA